MTERLLLTLADAAATLSLSERTLRYLIARGELAPVIHIGRAVRIPIATLRIFVEKRTDDVSASSVQMEPSNGRSTRLRAG